MLHAWVTPDPIHAAIERHRAAFDAYQVAPEGIASVEANDEYDAASEALVSTGCTTRFGALALVDHLRWWLQEEAKFSAGHQPAYGLAQVRMADLTLFLGEALPPAVTPTRLPLGEHLPPLRRHLDLRRIRRRLMLAGELLVAVAVVGGGMVLTGLATLL